MARTAIALLLIAAMLGGCTAARAPLPAMVAFGTSGDFGYSEKNLGGNRYEVTYVGPAVAVNANSPDTDARVGMEMDKVRDFALWRLADIAIAAGFPAFRIEQENKDRDLLIRDDVVPRPLFYPMYGHYGYHHYSPWWFNDDYWYDRRRRASVRAKATLTATLLPEIVTSEAAVFDAKKVQAEMQAKRGGAFY